MIRALKAFIADTGNNITYGKQMHQNSETLSYDNTESFFGIGRISIKLNIP